MNEHPADAGANSAASGNVTTQQQAGQSEEAFLEIVGHVRARAVELSALAAAILVALHLDICGDSRTFARLFDVPHALVLREITTLSGDAVPLVTIVGRNPRTQRTQLALAAAGAQLFAEPSAPGLGKLPRSSANIRKFGSASRLLERIDSMTADEIEELRIVIGEIAGANAPGATPNPIIAELRQALLMMGALPPELAEG